jgi:hypothetical protein
MKEMPSGYTKCREEGCKGISGHHTGYCRDHRPPVQCSKWGCKAVFIPKSMKSKFCDLHSKNVKKG